MPLLGREGPMMGWDGRHQSPWCEEVPETCSGHTAQQWEYQQGTRKWQKRVNSALQHDKGLLFLLRLT